jgi:molybdopterin/thiamine biosynthesis adenylyltransferase
MKKSEGHKKMLRYYPGREKDRKELRKLIKRLPKDRVIDQLESQIEELYYIRHPAVPSGSATRSELSGFTIKQLKIQEFASFGVYVYFPWNGYLVRFLPEALHLEILTSRNRNLITQEEQKKYYRGTVGIAGLSIGNSIVATMVHTGGPKYLKFADFDVLSASNINRIRTGFTNLGKKKTRIAQEEAYEVNPYLNIKTYDHGLSEDNLRDFLLTPKLNVLVEEMDNIYLKIQIRILARKCGIPVVMATDNGDSILLDIERYDLDQKYPLFHGTIPEKELFSVTPKIPKPQAARLITRWVKPENVDLRMQKSLLELGKSLHTWPQLGTAAFLSGVAGALAVRLVLTGAKIESGKYLISLDQLICPALRTISQRQERLLHTQLFKKRLDLK